MDFGQFFFFPDKPIVQVDNYIKHRFLSGFAFQVDCPLMPPVEKHSYKTYTKYFVHSHFAHPNIFRFVVLLTIKNIG